MNLSIRSQNGITVLALSGSLDSINAEKFKAEFLPAVDQAIAETDGAILDLAGLDYVSSAGLRILMLASLAARSKGATLVATAINRIVQEIFHISRLSTLIPCTATLDEAVAKFPKPEKEREGTIKLTFWGTRGSLPTCLDASSVRAKIAGALVKAAGKAISDDVRAQRFIDEELSFGEWGTFGGNSACIEIETGGSEYLLCDLGSGARAFGLSALDRNGGPTKAATYNVLMSHLHWDHIMGFPFLVPAYIPGNHIRIFGCHAELEEAFRHQQKAPGFPVEFDKLAAKIEFTRLSPGCASEICGFKVTPKAQIHGNDSYGYRIEKWGKVIVYSTDSEHKVDNQEEMDVFVEFFSDADVVLFDAQYSLADAMSLKADWGHSSNVVGVELCVRAGARHLVMLHHDPMLDDVRLEAIQGETRRFAELIGGGRDLRVTSAYDGLVLTI
jgi:anti-anti-sigma factor